MFPIPVNAAVIRSLANKYLACPIGETVTYAQLSAAMGSPATQKRHLLTSAMRLASKEAGALFKTIRTVGYMRLPGEQAHTFAPAARKKGRNVFRRASTLISHAMIKSNDISDDGRLKAYREQAALGLLIHMSYDRNLPVAKEGSAPPPTEETIRDTINAIRAHRQSEG